MTLEQERDTMARLGDIRVRRILAYEEGGLAAMPEATTDEDVDFLNEARALLSPYAEVVLSLYVDVWAEFERGVRCSVCGRTQAQNKAIGYDCAEGC